MSATPRPPWILVVLLLLVVVVVAVVVIVVVVLLFCCLLAEATLEIIGVDMCGDVDAPLEATHIIMCIYIYIYTHMYICIYIYIYRERGLSTFSRTRKPPRPLSTTV